MTDLSLEWVLQAACYPQRADLPEELQDTALQKPSKEARASVLIPLFWHENEWNVLFIRRVTNERDRHSGQVAFPGGRRDPADADATAVALREANEEIALAENEVNIIHVLPEYQTSSNFIVTPVVGIVPWPYRYQRQETEVARIFSIPLKWLADRANVELRDKEVISGDKTLSFKVVYYKHFDGELLWGASARMTLSLLKALHAGDVMLSSR